MDFSRRVGGDAEVCDLERDRLGAVAHRDRDCVAASSVTTRSDDCSLAVVLGLGLEPVDNDTVAGRKGGLGPLELVHERHALGERLGRRAAVGLRGVAAVIDDVAEEICECLGTVVAEQALGQPTLPLGLKSGRSLARDLADARSLRLKIKG